jgi:hypothetical protein
MGLRNQTFSPCANRVDIAESMASKPKRDDVLRRLLKTPPTPHIAKGQTSEKQCAAFGGELKPGNTKNRTKDDRPKFKA